MRCVISATRHRNLASLRLTKGLWAINGGAFAPWRGMGFLIQAAVLAKAQRRKGRNGGTTVPDTQVRDRLVSLIEIDKETPLLEIASRFGCSGYVAESVPLALCGASRIGSLDFKDVLMELIACGGDTDTNASMAGQVAGALIGRARLPEDLIARTPDRPLVEAVADAFAESLKFYE